MRRRPSRLTLLLLAGVLDSTGLAFGWTTFLLTVTERSGVGAAAVQSAAMLVGVALSAPFSGWLAARLSPRDGLRLLAAAEAACRVGLFVMLGLGAGASVTAPLVTVMNVLAWAGFAAMRAEVARLETAGAAAGGMPGRAAGRLLTMYAVAVAASEAVAAGAASVLLESSPPARLLLLVAALYGASLVPQWCVGLHAPAAAPRRTPHRAPVRIPAAPVALGGVVYLFAGAPVLMATVLAYEVHGATGVVVSAASFAACSTAAARVQGVVGRWRPAPLGACLLGAVMVGGWSLSGYSLIGLALAQGCAGVAQCALDGDLDARVTARTPASATTAALAYASSSRALGGALAVAVLPVMLHHASLAPVCATTAVGLVLAAAVSRLQPPTVRIPAARARLLPLDAAASGAPPAYALGPRERPAPQLVGSAG